MKILVTGTTGMLGGAMARLLQANGHLVTSITRREYDIEALPPIESLPLTGHDAIINCAGIINRRTDSLLPQTSYIVNGLFPRLLADRAEALDIPLIHISTDCVFDGTTGLHTEDAAPNATSLYGRSKSYGEPANAMVLRTSIIGPEEKNFYSLLCWFLAQEGTCSGYTNHLWNGITTLELGRISLAILERGWWQPALRHIHGEDVSKYELLQKIARAFGKKIDIHPTAPELAHDMRLRTRHTEFLKNLEVAPLDLQLQEVKRHSDHRGHWSSTTALEKSA